MTITPTTGTRFVTDRDAGFPTVRHDPLAALPGDGPCGLPRIVHLAARIAGWENARSVVQAVHGT